MKRLLLLAALVIVACLPVAGAAQAPLIEVSWGTLSPQAAEWPVYLADSQGFLKDEGVHVSIVYTGSPVTSINVLATNSTNMGDNGTDNLIAAISHALPIKIVGGIFSAMPYSLVTVPTIKSWADLKGKAV